MTSSSVQQRAVRIKLLLMDCDGVLTDGRIWLFENGEEQKGFHTRDGLGIDLWHRAGFSSGIISGRTSTTVERRARALGMTYIWQGRSDKEQIFTETLAHAGLTNAEVAYIGDDLNDIPLMLRSGLGVAVADQPEGVVVVPEPNVQPVLLDPPVRTTTGGALPAQAMTPLHHRDRREASPPVPF